MKNENLWQLLPRSLFLAWYVQHSDEVIVFFY